MEQVILVDEQDRAIGTMGKMEAHEKAILHRAFSVFIFNSRGDMLLQQRASGKYHSGGLWTNSCCSHPRPGEESNTAASRRLREEMGFYTSLEKIFDFVYKAEFANGLTEHEFDHVFAGYYDGPVQPDAREVSSFAFMPMQQIHASLTANPELYTAWFHIAFPKVMEWWTGTKLRRSI
ncbi:MAG: isopentenyl-diphosphate Delta-isomerase [Bacteroidota bacterium]